MDAQEAIQKALLRTDEAKMIREYAEQKLEPLKELSVLSVLTGRFRVKSNGWQFTVDDYGKRAYTGLVIDF